MDADLRKSSVHRILHLDHRKGLSDVLLRHESLQEAVEPLDGIDNLDVLVGGSMPSNPSEIIASSEMGSLLQVVTKEYDFVVIDTPPLISVSDAAVLGSQVDGILLVVRPGRVRREVARRTRHLLERMGTPVLGCVLNGVERTRSGGYYYYYDYYHSYADSGEGERIHKPKKTK